jgi:hypothetical protein
MKSQFYLLLAIPVFLVVLSGCENQDRSLDRHNWYVYKTKDTLVYKSTISNDTFVVAKINNYWFDSDKKNIEVLEITLPEINLNCSPYCVGMSIQHTYNAFSLNFRNINYGIKIDPSHDTLINYPIGNHSINDVFVLPSNFPQKEQKDVKTAYFTLIYGVIAYELFTGEVFELDEKYFE